MKLRYFLSLIISLSLFVSCDPNDTIEEYEKETTAIGENLAGEWYVTYTIGGVVQKVNSKISTFNTAKNEATSMWIDDHENYIGIKSIVSCDPTTDTFNAKDVDELYNDYKIDVVNGKILLDAAKTEAGNVTDSIYFEMTVYDASETTNVIVSGVRRTGFLEDEHE